MKKKSENNDRVDLVMEKWRQEFPQLDASAKSVVGRFIRLQVVILEAVSKTFKPFGINPGEYAVLCTLRVNGHPYQMPPKKIIEAVLLTSGGMSNLLERMEKKQLIKRVADPEDRRGVLVKLAPKGKTTIEAAMAAHVKVEHELIESLNKSETAALATMLKKLLLTLDPIN